MAKTGLPVAGPAGLGEWLPLLGAICQVLASLGDEDETKAGATPEGTSAHEIRDATDDGNSSRTTLSSKDPLEALTDKPAKKTTKKASKKSTKPKEKKS